ncbi:helix-turn-helix domain-containing protein, partial [Acinetobacter nosocomialis]|uniref:helix-turn-helix domain-containing protein n=1 Tax=Acinetobacter nosocomialis TaxID=106654 RepID=UPI0013D2B0FC
LEVLSSHDTPVRLADLSRELGMNKSTTYRMLETMSQLGYVQQDQPNGRYLITTRMWEIGVRAFQRLDIRAWAIPY